MGLELTPFQSCFESPPSLLSLIHMPGQTADSTEWSHPWSSRRRSAEARHKLWDVGIEGATDDAVLFGRGILGGRCQRPRERIVLWTKLK